MTGSQTSMVTAVASSPTASRAVRRTSAMRRGGTAASTSASIRLRLTRSSSNTARRPKKIPPAAPPARAGLARYRESMVSAVAGLYRNRPARGERRVSSKASQAGRLWSRR